MAGAPPSPSFDHDPGFTVESDGDGVTISIPPLPPARQWLFHAVSFGGIVIGPLAATLMLAAGLGWAGSLIVLGLILTPAVLVRMAVVWAECSPVDGPEVIFRLDAKRLTLTLRAWDGPRVTTWPRADVDSVGPALWGPWLVVRARGAVAAEVLHWHPRRVRQGVARVLNAELRTARIGDAAGYNPARGDGPFRTPSGRRPRPRFRSHPRAVL